MPVYPINKTYWGGFYNNHRVNGEDDRVYTAEDVRKPYDTVFTDGVMPSADGTAGDTLKVVAMGGMEIAVSAGHAKLGGAWFENRAAYNIVLDTAGAAVRYDCVIIRNDDSDAVREPSILIKSLTRVPTVDDLERSETAYEICVAYVKVAALAESITAANIVDTREDGSLCNIMGGVGAMVVRSFNNTVYSTTAGQSSIAIGIPQYNKSRDTLIVMVEGRVFTEGVNYTISSNTHIALTIGLPVIGTRVDFQVLKNVNAAGAETVVQEVAALREEMTAANRILQYDYYCNGVNDNIGISTLAHNFVTSSDTLYEDMTIRIHGHFGATAPRQGDGTSANPYIWILAGRSRETSRRVFLDFGNCDQITLPTGEAGKYYTVFYGLETHIKNCNIIANGADAYINMFSSPALTMNFCEDCRFWVTCAGGYVSRGGTFKNCRISYSTTVDNALIFNIMSGGLLRVFGGEYLCYAPAGKMSSVVYVNAAQTGAVAITYGMNCPEVLRGDMVQSYAINCLTNNALCSFTDTITTLPVEAAGQNIRGTIAISKAGMM